MAKPQLVEYESIDTLLEGYDKKPLVSARYKASCSDEISMATNEILSSLNHIFGFEGHALCYVEQIIYECVQNIHQHCNGISDVKIYTSQDRKKFIGAFELSEEAQFGKKCHEEYKNNLIKAHSKANSSEYLAGINDLFSCSESDKSAKFCLGTMMIMRVSGVEKVGIADIAKRAYFFFEYSNNHEAQS